MKWYVFALCSLLLGVMSCADDTVVPASTTECATLATSFKTDIQPILNSKCGSAGCHPNYTTYSGVSRIANNGELKYEVITTRKMPPTGNLSSSQLQLISCWLEAGAPNN